MHNIILKMSRSITHHYGTYIYIYGKSMVRNNIEKKKCYDYFYTRIIVFGRASRIRLCRGRAQIKKKNGNTIYMYIYTHTLIIILLIFLVLNFSQLLRSVVWEKAYLPILYFET